jgi:hypothetical protein
LGAGGFSESCNSTCGAVEAAGHALANSGKVNAYQLQAIMGHKDGRSTSIYVQGVAGLIKGLRD